VPFGSLFLALVRHPPSRKIHYRVGPKNQSILWTGNFGTLEIDVSHLMRIGIHRRPVMLTDFEKDGNLGFQKNTKSHHSLRMARQLLIHQSIHAIESVRILDIRMYQYCRNFRRRSFPYCGTQQTSTKSPSEPKVPFFTSTQYETEIQMAWRWQQHVCMYMKSWETPKTDASKRLLC